MRRHYEASQEITASDSGVQGDSLGRGHWNYGTLEQPGLGENFIYYTLLPVASPSPLKVSPCHGNCLIQPVFFLQNPSICTTAATGARSYVLVPIALLLSLEVVREPCVSLDPEAGAGCLSHRGQA